MHIRHLLGATAAVGALAIGSATSAAAATTSPPPTGATAAPGTKCGPKVSARLDHLVAGRAKIEVRIDALKKLEAEAATEHHIHRVEKLTDRVTNLQKHRDAFTDRIKKLEQRCHLPAPTTPVTPAP